MTGSPPATRARASGTAWASVVDDDDRHDRHPVEQRATGGRVRRLDNGDLLARAR